MQCPKCGWQNPDDAAKCTNCYAELVPGAPQQPQPAQQPYQTPIAGIGQPVPSFMTWSIVVTAVAVLMCNLPSLVLGIIGIIKSSSANTKTAAGDLLGAGSDANTAKILVIVGAALLVVGLLLWVPFMLGLVHGFSRFGSSARPGF